MKLVNSEELVKLNVLMSHEELEAFLENFLKVCVEETLRAIPSAISHLVNSATTMKSLSENFYKDNPDLVDHRALVTKTMEGIEGRHPELGLKSLLEKTGVKAKQVLLDGKGFSTEPTKRPNIVSMDAGFGEL